MKVFGIIPARYASSRLPGKPLRLICGKPMVLRVYERALKAQCWNQLVVATDDQRIKEVIENAGGIALITSRDHSSGTDRIAEACDLLKLDDNDLVVNIQGDEPLLPYKSIKAMVHTFKTGINASMGTLAYKATDYEEFNNANVVKVVTDRDGNALYFSRAPIPHTRETSTDGISFLKHLGFYIYPVRFLKVFTQLPQGHLENLEKLEQLRALENGYKIKVIISEVDSYGVDTEDDLARVEKIILERG
ncbi:MAG: 3-deoxy-manno-octulosonate cytidylyltransferase [Deltaproteobacteria bacterium]|nr:MAG: 3-deoxy-manno-octulosonate cytidylyltransferase [Deltaproteobacteria bacterium]